MSKPTASERMHTQTTIPGIDLDKPVATHHHARPVIGNVVEDFCAALLGGCRLRVDPRCLCPDIRSNCPVLSEGTNHLYYECKSVGSGGTSHLFKSRVDKYEDWIKNGSPKELQYVYVFHDAQWVEGDTVRSLEERVIDTIHRVLIIDIKRLHELLGYIKLAKFDITDRPELSEGWRLPRAVLDTLWCASDRDGFLPFEFETSWNDNEEVSTDAKVKYYRTNPFGFGEIL